MKNIVSISLKYDKIYNLKCMIVNDNNTLYDYTSECKDKYFLENLLYNNTVFVFDIKYFIKYLINKNINFDINKIDDLKLITNLTENRQNININYYTQSKNYVDSFSKLNSFIKIFKDDYINYIPFYILKEICSVESKIINDNIIIYNNEYYKNIKKYLLSLSLCELNGIKITDNSIKNINGYIYPLYNYDSSRTGRLNNTYPINLQNLSENDEIRKKLISRFENGLILHADWNSIDLRVAFAIAEENINSDDLHKTIAEIIYNKEIDDEDRKKIKEINFGILYSSSLKTISEKLNIPIDEVKLIYKKVFEKFPKLFNLIKSNNEAVKESGHVYSYFGRKRNLNSDEYTKFFNSKIQMTSSDICYRAIDSIIEKTKNLKSKLIPYIVFDKLALDVHKEEKNIIEKIVIESMSFDAPGNLTNFVNFPIKIEYKTTL